MEDIIFEIDLIKKKDDKLFDEFQRIDTEVKVLRRTNEEIRNELSDLKQITNSLIDRTKKLPDIEDIERAFGRRKWE